MVKCQSNVSFLDRKLYSTLLNTLSCCYIFDVKDRNLTVDQLCSSICKISTFLGSHLFNRLWWFSENRSREGQNIQFSPPTTGLKCRLVLGDLVGLPGCDNVSPGLSLWSWDLLYSKPHQTPCVCWVGPSFAETQEAQLDHTGSLYHGAWKSATSCSWSHDEDIFGIQLRKERKERLREKRDRERGPDCLVTESWKLCELPKRQHIVFVRSSVSDSQT